MNGVAYVDEEVRKCPCCYPETEEEKSATECGLLEERVELLLGESERH